MEKENINLTINGEVREPIQIILREGEAEKIQYPKKYVQKGVISAPLHYSQKIKEPHNALVEFSTEDRWIKLFEDPTNEKGAEVEGRVSISKELLEFGINKDKFFTSSQLIKLIRKYAHCFKTTQDAKDLIVSLQNFEVKFEQVHKKEDDRKGNTEESIKNAIKFYKGEINPNWNLFIPLFIGSPKVDVSVEIEIERRDSTPVFGFYSIDLELIFENQSQQLIEDQLEGLKEKNITVIQIS